MAWRIATRWQALGGLVSVTHPVFTATIKGSLEVIFDLIADMPNYHRWLPGSDAFGGTTQVTPYPVQLGTTYLDGGPLGMRPGSVTVFERPKRLGFHHTMAFKKGPLRGDADIEILYTLEPVEGDAIHVMRKLDMAIVIPGIMRLAEPLVLRAFQKENLRIMAELKKYVEGLSQALKPS
jgi:hypothetical protein